MPVGIRILKTRDIEMIFEAAVDVLGRTGSVVEDETAVALLRKSGVRVDGSNRVYIPSAMVTNAISTAPSSITVYDRLGNKAMVLEERNSYFGAQVNCKELIDPTTDQRRRMTLEDIGQAAFVIDALPNIDWFGQVDIVADVAVEYANAAIFGAELLSTSKPMIIPLDVLHPEVAYMMYDLAAAAAGGHSSLCEKPFIISGDSSISPLFHPREAIANLLFLAEKGLPCVYNPMPQGGITAPTTMAGVLTMTMAEVFTALVIGQLANPGSPFICGGVPSIFDMRDNTFVYGSPELFLMCSALADIAHHYNLPCFGTAGMTNSKIVDLQAATDSSLSSLMAVLSGSNLIHDVGLVDIGSLNSLPMIVLTDEIIGMIRYIEKGIEVTPDTLAVDVIHSVGPRGDFITEDHTLRYFRDCWYPGLFDHSLVRTDNSPEGRKIIEQEIQKRIDDILRNHVPAELPIDAKKMISSFAEAKSIDPLRKVSLKYE